MSEDDTCPASEGLCVDFNGIVRCFQCGEQVNIWDREDHYVRVNDPQETGSD